MKKNYTFTTNKTANVSDFSLLLLDYLSRDDDDVKTFSTLVEDEDGQTVMEIDTDKDTILFDRRLLQDVMKDILKDIAALARASALNIDKDEISKEDDDDDDEDEDDDADGWEIDDDNEGEDDKSKIVDTPSVTVADGRTFHVGDRVRATCGNSLCGYKAGDWGVILDVDPDDDTVPLLVRFDNSYKIWSRGRNLALISK